MNGSEVLVIIIVALIAFGPKQLPMLAEHLGKLFRYFNHGKQQITTFWHTQIAQQQLRDNQKKAEEVDKAYQNKTKF